MPETVVEDVEHSSQTPKNDSGSKKETQNKNSIITYKKVSGSVNSRSDETEQYSANSFADNYKGEPILDNNMYFTGEQRTTQNSNNFKHN